MAFMNWDYRPIISGQRRDVLAIFARGFLGGCSLPYGWVVGHRNRGFDSGKRPIECAEVPVISVGNLTTGGTGKTPIVCHLAKWFRARDVRVAIVSRGYGRGDGDANDEAMELADRLPDVPHVQDADRVEAARIAVEELETELILMDDGFQHRRLHRNLDIVVIDSTCPFGYGSLLPGGLLREPIQNLRRADLVILTRCDAVAAGEIDNIEREIRDHHDEVPIFRSSHRPSGLLEFPGTLHDIAELHGQTVALVSAIGNPEAFQQTVQACGASVIESKKLPDHDPYEPETVASIRDWVSRLGDRVDRVVCTHKDLVKLRTDRIGGKPLSAIQIDLDIDGDLSPYLDPLLIES